MPGGGEQKRSQKVKRELKKKRAPVKARLFLAGVGYKKKKC